MTYDERFFAENIEPSLRAAKAVLPGVISRLSPFSKSVIDIGCAQGAWLSVAKAEGCTVHGFDGFAPEGDLLIDQSEFEHKDITNGVSCAGYDLAMCLEVAEHLPETSSRALVAGLCEARFVLFSAAIPHQHGMNHINEQWQTWWAGLFAETGYAGSCNVRWSNWTNDEIEPYYKANLTIYAKDADLKLVGMTPGVVDVVHPGLWEYRNR